MNLKNSMDQRVSYKREVPWYLSYINPGITMNNIPIVFDIPSNLTIGNLYILPQKGFGKATPISLHTK